MQVSVPGMYQNPAPYSEQIFTYPTALAFTGRSAACAPPTAIRPAAEPSKRLLTNFKLNLQVALQGRSLTGRPLPQPPLNHRFGPLRAFGHTRMNARDLSE